MKNGYSDNSRIVEAVNSVLQAYDEGTCNDPWAQLQGFINSPGDRGAVINVLLRYSQGTKYGEELQKAYDLLDDVFAQASHDIRKERGS